MEIVERSVTEKNAIAATVETVSSVVVPPFDAQAFQNIDITIQNTGSQALNACKVQSAPADIAALWKDEDTTTFATLAGGAVLNKTFTGNARKLWRVTATVATSTTTLLSWISGN